MKKSIVLPLLAATLLLGACRHKEPLPEGIMDTAEMADFMTEVYLFEGYYAITNNHNYDTVSPEVLRAYDDMLAKRGLSRAEADSNLKYYTEHPDLFAKVNDAVLRRLETETKGSPVTEKPEGVEIKIFK